MQKEKEIVENYYNYLTGKTKELEAVLLKPELEKRVIDALNAAIEGFKTELKWVTFRLDNLKVREEKELGVTLTVSK